MNKKIIALIAVIIIAVIALYFISSGSKDKTDADSATEGQPITVNINREPPELPATTVSYDKKITVTLPIDVVDEEYGDDLEAFAEANGFFSIKKKGDDAVKIKMRDYSYRLILTTAAIETVSGVGYVIDSGDYSFVSKIAKYNDDFSEIIFTVDKEKYENAENKDDFFTSVAYCCLHYQKYCEENKKSCNIIICEKGTNILIESRELREKDLG